MASILHKRGTGIPTAGDLSVGELAIDTGTGKVYTKTAGGDVVEVGGGGGGGIVGMKLAAQPSSAGDFSHSLNDTSLYSGQPGATFTSKWWSTTGINSTTHGSYTTTTFTVPSGMNFMLQAIGKGSYTVLLNSINIDNTVIYPTIDAATHIGQEAWPGSSQTDIVAYYGSASDTPIIVESSLSFKVKTSSGGSVKVNIYGFFVEA